MQDWQAQKSAQASAANALQAAFPHLVPVSAKNNSRVAAAKNMRIELKALWPSVKFSVKGSSFSGGDSIDVRWVDGPNVAQVDTVICRYKAGSFNGMEDLYEYSRDAWKDAFGDAKYVSSQRNNSDKAIASALRLVVSQYPDDLAGVDVSVEAYNAGKLSSVRIWNDWLPTLVYRVAAKRIWCLPKKVTAMVDPEQVEA